MRLRIKANVQDGASRIRLDLAKVSILLATLTILFAFISAIVATVMKANLAGTRYTLVVVSGRPKVDDSQIIIESRTTKYVGHLRPHDPFSKVLERHFGNFQNIEKTRAFFLADHGVVKEKLPHSAG